MQKAHGSIFDDAAYHYFLQRNKHEHYHTRVSLCARVARSIFNAAERERRLLREREGNKRPTSRVIWKFTGKGRIPSLSWICSLILVLKMSLQFGVKVRLLDLKTLTSTVNCKTWILVFVKFLLPNSK